MHSLYSIREDAALLEQTLTPLQRAELDAALNLHALLHPGRALHIDVSTGTIAQMPVFSGAASERAATAGTPIATLIMESTAQGDPDPDPAPVVRHIRLAHSDATPATTRPPRPLSLARRVYGFLERRAPLLIDAVRETIMRRRERPTSRPLPRYPHGPGDAEIVAAYERLAPTVAPADAPRAVLFGLYWLQTGGAERWAVECIELAKQAGLMPIVVVDHDSVHPWLPRPELQGCTVIALSSEAQQPDLAPELAAALLANFELRGVMIHHSTWLYRALPWIRLQRPEVPVIDSLHIVEYLGGGFPGLAARFDDYIDTHHAISPELVRWLEDVQGIDPAHIVMAPLTALTVDASHDFSARDPKAPFTLAYVGRLSRQKRPELFVLLVRELRRRGIAARAVMHGDGEMRGTVDALIARFGLGDLIEQRFENQPVRGTLAEADLLVLTSINEGLTLTTFEALAAGIPVLSSDVGSQRTIVQDELLLPRPARPFLRGAVAAIAALARSEQAREHAWTAQRARVEAFGRNPDARHFTQETFAQWQQ